MKSPCWFDDLDRKPLLVFMQGGVLSVWELALSVEFDDGPVERSYLLMVRDDGEQLWSRVGVAGRRGEGAVYEEVASELEQRDLDAIGKLYSSRMMLEGSSGGAISIEQE